MSTSTPLPSLKESVASFLRVLEGKNRSSSTIEAYRSDLHQFLSWLHQNNGVAQSPADVERADIAEYLTALSRKGISGLSRARKLAAIREYFRYLICHEILVKSPAEGVETPKKERHSRTHLRSEEYNKILSLAGANIRDYAILQVFLQTGIRVSELCQLKVQDVDLQNKVLRVRLGKGMVSRDIELEKKVIQAIKNWMDKRKNEDSEYLFLNKFGEQLTDRAIQMLVKAYAEKAGINKKVTPHSLRHTFATYKAENGVSPFQLKEWLGHQNLNTTQIYVHMARQNAKKVMEATSL